MNVLYTIQTHGPGGAESVMVNLANCFNQGRWRAFGFFLREGWIANEFRRHNLPVETCESKWLLDVPLLIRLFREVKKHSIGLLHAHEFHMGFYCSLVSEITGIPCLTTYHGKSPYSLERKVRFLAFNHTIKRSFPVAVSHSLRDWIVTNYEAPRDRIEVVHNGIDPATFTRGAKDRRGSRQDIMGLIGAPDESLLVVTVARLFPVKAIKNLVAAASIVRRDCPTAHFVVAGDGPERPALEALVRHLGLNSSFHFLGECDFVPTLLKASDLFVLPSDSEELSIAILEAMASQLPVIATDVGDNRYLVHNERNGFLVPPGSPALLADRILYLTAHSNRWQTMGRESQRIVEHSFSNDKMIARYAEIYERLRRR